MKIHKKEKIAEKYELAYFILENMDGDAQCLICHSIAHRSSEYYLKRHYYAVHGHFENIIGDERELKLLELKANFFLNYVFVDSAVNVSAEINKNQIREASYLVALHLTKKGGPLDDGNFFKDLGKEFFNCFGESGKEACRILEAVPVSRNTITRRTENISSFLYSCTLKRLENCVNFSISLDETTDLNSISQLIVCVKSVNENFDTFEEVLNLVPMHGHATGALIFQAIDKRVFSTVDVKKMGSCCTDGAKVMVGENLGLMGQFIKHNIDVVAFHCMIHQQALFAKELNIVKAMEAAVKIINKIKGGHHALTHRKLKVFLKELSAEYGDLLLYTEVRWLSRGKCLERLLNLKEEIQLFLQESDDPELFEMASKFKNKDFLSDLAFLVDMTSLLNQLNLNLQGKNKTIFDLVDSVDQFERKLNILVTEVSNGDISNLPRTYEVIIDYNNNQKLREYLNVLKSILTNLQKRFQDFNKIKKYIALHNDPLHCGIQGLESNIIEELEKMRTDFNLPYGTKREFWRQIDGTIYPNIKNLMYKMYSYFGSTYNCEAAFSTLRFIQNKYRNKISDKHLEDLLRIKTYEFEIDIKELIEFNDNEMLRKKINKVPTN